MDLFLELRSSRQKTWRSPLIGAALFLTALPLQAGGFPFIADSKPKPDAEVERIDPMVFATEPAELSRKDANDALRRALHRRDYDSAKKLGMLLSGAASNADTADEIVTLDSASVHTLFKPLGLEVRDAAEPYALVRPRWPDQVAHDATPRFSHAINGQALRLGPEDPDGDPSGGEPNGNPGDPGGPGGSDLAAWEASFSNPRDLLLAIPPASIVGSPNHPHVRAQIKWRNHSMVFWRALFTPVGNVPSQYGSGQINWLKVWYEQTHLESYREATIFNLGMGGDDGFQNHGGANPNAGGNFNGPTPLTLEQMPEFFAVWNAGNPNPMPGILSEAFIGAQYEEEFGFLYDPPDPAAMEWFQRFLGVLGIEWNSNLHPVLNSAPYMWTIVNFSLGNVPSGGVEPPPGLLPPLIGREGQTAGSILADYNDLRFDIRRRLDNGESAHSIIKEYAGAEGLAAFNFKFRVYVADVLQGFRTLGLSTDLINDYREATERFIIDNICGTNAGSSCGVLLGDVEEMIYRFIGEQLSLEFQERAEIEVLDHEWLSTASILLMGMPLEVRIETIAALQDIEGWPPAGLEQFDGFAILDTLWLSNGSQSSLFQEVLVWGGHHRGFVNFLRHFFVDTDRWRDYVDGLPDPGGSGNPDPTGGEVRGVFPLLNELDVLVDSSELNGYDPSWKTFFSLLKAGAEARLKVRVRDNPALTDAPQAVTEAIFKEVLKEVGQGIFEDFATSGGFDLNNPAVKTLLGMIYNSAWEGMLDMLLGEDADFFFDKFKQDLATRLNTSPQSLDDLEAFSKKYGKLIGRANLAVTVVEILDVGVRIYSQWLDYSTGQITTSLTNGLYLYEGPVSRQQVTAAQWHYERVTGRSSWNMSPFDLAIWAAGQDADDYDGPVTIYFEDGPPAPSGGFEGNEGVWAYSRVLPSQGFVPTDPNTNAAFPDLRIDNASVALAVVGDDLRVTFLGDLRNLGEGYAAPSTIQFYWTLSNGTSGRFGGFGKWVDGVAPGGSRSFSQSLIEPNYLDLVPGTYHVYYIADDADEVYESNEGNNRSPTLFAITIP